MRPLARPLKAWCHLSLGLWHVYKHAAISVYRLASSAFLGPLFHMFFPGQRYFLTPKLRFATYFFHLTRLAYPSFREQLRSCLAALPSESLFGVYARNLHFFVEYLIPTVPSLLLR